MNQALMGNWLQRFFVERCGDLKMWNRECEMEDWRSKDMRCSSGVGLWKTIIKGCEKFLTGLNFKAGNGTIEEE